ncbi:MAG: Rhs element Vgr protein [Arenicella sp.]|jgi:Rhs element Vgr protein
MTANQIKSGGVVTSIIKVGGSAIPGIYQVYSITVEKFVNRISRATVVILDGDAAKESFPASASDVFVPGNKISIQAGYDGKTKQVFSGIITKQSLRVDNDIGSSLEVECKDEAVKMTIGRKSASFANKTDSSVLESIISTYGLGTKVDSTEATLPQLQQYYTSDWDFMLARAEVNGLLVKTLNNKVSVFSPTKNTDSVLSVTYGDNLYSFDADLDCLTQLSDVKASAWDYKTQGLISGQASSSLSGAGNLSSKILSNVVGLRDFQLQTSAALDNADLKTWAKAQMLKSELSKIIGDVEFQGSNLVEPGSYITLKGMGPRFDGKHLVSGVSHVISHGNWFSTASIGLSSHWFIQEADVVAPMAAGLLPGVQGLYNATVKKLYDDPDNELRILIDLPLFDPQGEGLWARLSNFYSTDGAGAFFLPEVDDEVIVGFLNSDPRYPVIMGSLYSSKIKPFSELSPTENNPVKGIVSKSQLRVVFDDENKILSLITPGKNQMIFDDKKGQISIKDQNENSIVMSSDGITIKSPKEIKIEAGQNIEISGDTGIKVTASGGDVETSGTNIKETADAQYSAEAGGTVSIQASTELSINGAMVMIN